MPEMIRLHGSVKKYGKAFTEAIFILLMINHYCEKIRTYVPTLFTKLLQLKCIVSLNDNSSLHKKKVYKKSPSYKIYDILDQVKNILTAVEGGVLSGVLCGLLLINDETFLWLH